MNAKGQGLTTVCQKQNFGKSYSVSNNVLKQLLTLKLLSQI